MRARGGIVHSTFPREKTNLWNQADHCAVEGTSTTIQHVTMPLLIFYHRVVLYQGLLASIVKEIGAGKGEGRARAQRPVRARATGWLPEGIRYARPVWTLLCSI